MADNAPGEVKEYLKLFGAPSSCPVEDVSISIQLFQKHYLIFFLYFQGKVCGDEHTVDLSKYKALLSMAKGHIVIDSNIEHDTVSNLLQVYI